jgi:hypothetical protein
MPNEMLRKYQYNHIAWFHYHLSKFGFDCYCAKFESPLPNKLPKVEIGRWFIDLRFYKWQLALSRAARKATQPKSERSNHSISYNNPTFNL